MAQTAKAPPDERGGNGYVWPTVTAPHLDSTPTAGSRGCKNSFGYVRYNGLAEPLRHSPEVDPNRALRALGANLVHTHAMQRLRTCRPFRSAFAIRKFKGQHHLGQRTSSSVATALALPRRWKVEGAVQSIAVTKSAQNRCMTGTVSHAHQPSNLSMEGK